MCTVLLNQQLEAGQEAPGEGSRQNLSSEAERDGPWFPVPLRGRVGVNHDRSDSLASCPLFVFASEVAREVQGSRPAETLTGGQFLEWGGTGLCWKMGVLTT